MVSKCTGGVTQVVQEGSHARLDEDRGPHVDGEGDYAFMLTLE